MTSKRFVLCPGPVFSTHDMQQHWIGSADLARLYGLTRAECEVFREDGEYDKSLPPLHPLSDGRYKEHLEQMKIEYFQQYMKARRLEKHNIDMKRPEYAERNRRKAEWLAKPFPDFPEVFDQIAKERNW